MNSHTSDAAIGEVIESLESISESFQDSKHRKRIEGSIWVLKHRLEMVSSVFFPTDEEFNLSLTPHRQRRESVDLVLDDTHSSPRISPGGTSVSTVDSNGYDNQKPRLERRDSHEISLLDSDRSSSKPNMDWKPSSWFLRTKAHERRHSGDVSEHQAHFQKRLMHLHQRLRRRKSISEETLQLAAAQGHQLSLIRDATSHHSNPTLSFPPIPIPYRRSRSAVTVSDVSIMTESPGAVSSARILRKYSLSCLSGTSTEVWPETITGLLTGGQLLMDRSILFSLLAEELDVSSDASPKHVSGPLMFSSRKTEGLSMLSGGVSIPRPDKKWGGEDAFFVSNDGSGFAGVADGVGEWGELGCNPRQFAEEIMGGAKKEASVIHRQTSNRAYPERASIRAQRVLAAGFKSAQSFGSSTALVGGLDAEGRTLGIANIGDSSCLVLRRESKRHRHFIAFRRTKEQQHFFNCPFQLSKVPDKEDLPKLASQGMHGLVRSLSSLSVQLESDTPEMADLYDIKVQEGDLVILATDGVFDNLFDHEIANLVSFSISPLEASAVSAILSSKRREALLPHPNAFLPPFKHDDLGFATPPHNIAQAISEAAFYRSLDPRARTPFARQSRRAGGLFAGGKMDDITCVAIWMV